MTTCYAIEKDSIGWVVRAGGKAVLICREKRMAIDTARYAGALLVLDGEISPHEHGLEASLHTAKRRGVRGAVAVEAMGLKIA